MILTHASLRRKLAHTSVIPTPTVAFLSLSIHFPSLFYVASNLGTIVLPTLYCLKYASPDNTVLQHRWGFTVATSFNRPLADCITKNIFHSILVEPLMTFGP